MAARKVVGAVFLPVFLFFFASCAFAQTTDHYEYDSLGRLIKVTSQGGHNDGHDSDYHYDAAGNRTAVTSTGSPVVPGFSVSGATASEGNPLTFTVTLADATAAATVSYATVNGSAAAGADYSATSGTLSFAAGETSKTVTVNTATDLVSEGDETLQLVLSSPSGAVIRVGSASGTITDVPMGRLAIAGGSAAEGDPLVFTVTRTGVTSVAASVGYASSNGTASAGADYTAVGGTLSFAPGETSKTISVPTIRDALAETDETVQMTLSSPSGAVIDTASAAGTITDVPMGALSIADASGSEGDALVFTVTRAGATQIAASVSYATADGSATAGADYMATSGTLNFAPGEVSKTITVSTSGDVLTEGGETFQIVLSSASGALIGTASATGTIADVPVGSLSIAGASGNEGDGLVFTVTRTGGTNIASSVNYATSNGTATAGTDYMAASGTLSFAPGETSKTITVYATTDIASEASETFAVTLSSPTGAVIGIASAQGTIADVVTSTLSIADKWAYEGDAIVFTVTRSGAPNTAVSVNYATANGTAVAGSDYTPVSGTLSFAAGEVSKTISIDTTYDLLVEGSESFQVALSAPVRAVVVTAPATATLVDPPYNVSIQSASGNEGEALVFNVSRTGLTDRAASFPYATADQTATAGTDYAGVSGTVSFAPGQTSTTITINTMTDAVFENNETFGVTISSPNGPSTATGTILEVPADTLSVAAASAVEGSPVVFTVTRTGPAVGTVTVNFTTSSGTATGGGTDYSGLTGQLSFAPGETSKTISISTLADLIEEGDESFQLTLSAPYGAGLGVSTATGTIVNNPVGPDAFSVTGGSAGEGGSLTFTITRTGAATGTASVTYGMGDGTATRWEDYWPQSGTLTFAPGEMSKTITVALLVDGEDEPDETFLFGLSMPTGAVISNGSATGTIFSLGSVRIVPSFPSPSALEGLPIVFTVTRSGSSSQPASVAYATSDGTAIAGSDYVATSGILSFAAGEASKTISVETLADTVAESAENLTLTLSSPNGMTLGSPVSATGSIGNVTAGPLSVANVTGVEGGTMVFTVKRTGGGAATVNYATANGTAVAGSDYTAMSGVLSFAVGQLQATISVPIATDALVEGNETFLLNLSSPVGTTLTNSSATGRISDLGTLSVANASASEGSTLTFTVTRTGPTNQTVNVNYATSDGSAVAGLDYTAVSGTLTFTSGQTSKTITVPIASDSLIEGSESFQVTLAPVTNAAISNAVATGTITDVAPGG